MSGYRRVVRTLRKIMEEKKMDKSKYVDCGSYILQFLQIPDAVPGSLLLAWNEEKKMFGHGGNIISSLADLTDEQAEKIALKLPAIEGQLTWYVQYLGSPETAMAKHSIHTAAMSVGVEIKDFPNTFIVKTDKVNESKRVADRV